MPHPSDAQLVSALLEATATLSLREREAKTGISHNTFRRFQAGDWKVLQRDTRAAISVYLERVGKMPKGIPAVPLTDPERARLLELWEEIGAILRGTSR